MAEEQVIALLLQRVVKPLEADGTTAEFVDVHEGIATIRYRIGQNADCENCFMPPEDFREFFLAALEHTVPSVVDVRVVLEESAAEAS